MAQINIRIDDNLKEKAEILFEELGLNMSTAFNIFIRQSIRQGGIPFEITTQVDPFENLEAGGSNPATLYGNNRKIKSISNKTRLSVSSIKAY